MPYFQKIVGTKVYLSPITKDDPEKYCTWLNNLEIGLKLNMQTANISMSQEVETLERLMKDGNHFAIVDKENEEVIGNCGYNKVNHINRSATIGIFIGDNNYWNKGYGTEVIDLILNYGFNILNLHNIMLEVKEFNKGAIKCYEKCGFKLIGRRREDSIYGIKKYDTLYMDIISSEYNGNINDLLKDYSLKL